jgi:hypothetical protein
MNYFLLIFLDVQMAGSRWREVRQALAEVANEAMQYDADGVEICFLNSPRRENYVSVSIGFNPTVSLRTEEFSRREMLCFVSSMKFDPLVCNRYYTHSQILIYGYRSYTYRCKATSDSRRNNENSR